MKQFDRRDLLLGVVALPALGLAACAPRTGYESVEEGVRRLLTLSSQRAFARLSAPNGFYDTQVARIAPPDLGGSGSGWRGVLGAALQSEAARRRIALALNDVATVAVRSAMPAVMDRIRAMPLRDAVGVLRGGPTAATDLLEQEAGASLFDAMLPGISRGLRADMAEMIGAALMQATGIDYIELGQTIAADAAHGVFRTIGEEERAIRADPRRLGDDLLARLLARP